MPESIQGLEIQGRPFLSSDDSPGNIEIMGPPVLQINKR
jgi:hypothetical protein